MTNQQFTIAELGARFGSQMGQVLSELIVLEKLVDAQQTQIQEMTTNETVLVENIQALEAELAELKSAPHVAAEKAVYEDELAKLKMIPRPLSEAEREIAAQGSAIIAEGKEKAAP